MSLRLVGSSLIFLLGLFFVGQSASWAQAPRKTTSQQEAQAEAAAAAQALLKSVRDIAGTMEEMRGEKFRQPAVAVRVPDDLRLAAAEIRAGNVISRDRLAARGRAWADLGLGGEGSPARLITLLARDLQDVGFDPSANRLLVAPELLTEEDYTPSADLDGPATVLMATGVRRDEPVFGHVLMHVRQRERGTADFLADTTDALLAQAALAEGEANLLALRFLFDGMGLADDLTTFSLRVSEYLDGNLVPKDLDALIGAESDMLRFVYLDGFAIAVELFQEGGWDRIDKALGSARTSRDVIHPDRKPVTVAPFPDPAPPRPGLKLADEDVLGEQGMIVLVSRLTGKDNLALDVGDGWMGDRLYRWEGPDGDGVTEWVTRWATPEDVEDFLWGLGKMFKARFPGIELKTADAGKELATPDKVFKVQEAGLEVRIQVHPVAVSSAGP